METTDQNMHVENSEDLGPLLMHDPEDEEDVHSLSPSDQHSLLSDVHLPDGSTFIPSDVSKDHQLEGIDHSINIDKEESSPSKSNVEESQSEHSQDQVTPFKFTDGQPVQLEDGSTAYILTSYKEGTQAIILEDGTTAYISHEPPTSQSSIFEMGGLEGLPSVSETEEKRLVAAASSMTSNEHKLFKCEFEGCKKVYTSYHHLQYHSRSHLDKKPFVCGFARCEKTFATSYGLKSHIRVHTGEKPYKCPEDINCKKAFKTSGDLQKHIRTHTGEKPFRCPFEGCNRSFTTSNIRKVHIRTHTGERPYSCDDCGKKFASATNHKNHMRIHTGERPYLCTYEGCSKRFTEYSSLYKHQVVHSVEKPYTCSHCGKLYRQASTLAMHKRTAHGENEMITDVHMMDAQLIALDQQGKAGMMQGEVVGMIGNQKQYSGAANVNHTQPGLSPSSLDKSAGSSQQLHFAHLDSHNVVIVTDPSCFKVMQTQVSSSEPITSCMVEQEDSLDERRGSLNSSAADHAMRASADVNSLVLNASNISNNSIS